MLDWFRSWHGAPTDAKWLVIGKRAGVAPGVVSAVMWALFDHASQNEDRGEVAGFDFETYSAFSGFEEDKVRAVYAALEGKGIVVSGRIAQWEKRQPKREDGSAERVRAHRKKAEPQPSLPIDDPPKEPEQALVVEPPTEATKATSLLTPEAMTLADDVAVAVGHDLRFLPPAWCGAAYRTQMWLSSGWNPDFILQCVKAQMTRKRDGPPDRINYFEKGIAEEIARAKAPMPEVKIVESEILHAKVGNGSGGGFASLSLDLSRQARDEAERDRATPILRIVDG